MLLEQYFNKHGEKENDTRQGDKLKVKERGATCQISERMGACASEVLILPLAISL